MSEPAQTVELSGRRRGRKRRGNQSDGPSKINQLPWKQIELPFAPQDLLSADQVEAIHHASVKILSEIGMEFMSATARSILKAAGVEVDESSHMVRFDPALVEETIKTAPSQFTMHARNPARNLQIGGRFIANGCVSSPPNASDMDDGRRPGNTKDYQNLLRLSQHFNIVHLIGGYPVEPIDRHAATRHLDCTRDMIALTDKVVSGYCIGSERINDAMEIVRLARDVSETEFQMQPSIFSVVNTNSPLKFDVAMLEGLMAMAKRGQVVCVTPFTLAGAMAPVTLAGALAQQNAEALAGLVMCQLTKPGAPFVYGGFTSNVDMKSGAPAFGTPEYMKAAIAGGQLARRYNVPYRTSGVNASNMVDAQAAYESVFSLWATTMGAGNIIKHAAGWMEGGLVASFEKFILDVDLLQMVSKFLEPIEVNDDEFGFDAISEAGVGGHFFGTAHTQARYKNAFYAPILSDWRNYESWVEQGSPQTWEKANKLYKQALEEYEEPPIDPARMEAVDSFVAQRKEDGGVATDF